MRRDLNAIGNFLRERVGHDEWFSMSLAARFHMVQAVDALVADELRAAANDLERRAGEFKHLSGDRYVRRTHNDIATWLRKRAKVPRRQPVAAKGITP